MPSGGGPHRPPLQRPGHTPRRLDAGGADGAGQGGSAVRQNDGKRVPVIRGADHHGRGPPLLPRFWLGGPGAAPLKEIHTQVISVTNELSHHLGRAPTASELATELGIDRQEVVEAIIAGNCYSATSMDAFRPSGGQRDGFTIHDTMGALDRHLADLVDREALRR